LKEFFNDIFWKEVFWMSYKNELIVKVCNETNVERHKVEKVYQTIFEKKSADRRRKK